MRGSDPLDPVVRVATAADLTEIGRLLSLLGHPIAETSARAVWEAWAAGGDSALVAARPDGTLAGLVTLHTMIVLHRERPVGRITALVVDPPSRGRGIGRALVSAAERRLAEAGCGLLEVTSNLRLADAHAFYEHLGYGRTSIRLAKELSAPIRPAPARPHAEPRLTRQPHGS